MVLCYFLHQAGRIQCQNVPHNAVVVELDEIWRFLHAKKQTLELEDFLPQLRSLYGVNDDRKDTLLFFREHSQNRNTEKWRENYPANTFRTRA